MARFTVPEMNSDIIKAALAGVLVLSGCVLASPCISDPHTVRLGVLAGPGVEIAAAVKAQTPDDDLPLDVVAFEDPVVLARELDNGHVDAAELPSTPFLDQRRAETGHPFAVVGYTVTLPIAVYSRKVRQLRALRAGDEIAIPDGAVDRARALILLHNAGVVVLKYGVGFAATVADIEDNPRDIKVRETPAADLAAALDRVAAAVIPFADAARASLAPARDGLVVEDGHSPYAQILTVKGDDRDPAWAIPLLKRYQSPAIKTFILTRFNGSVRRPW